MPKDDERTVVAVLVKNMRVLACCPEDGGHGGVCAFPSCKTKRDGDPVDACSDLFASELGCRLSTTWLLHTLSREEDGLTTVMDCYVCSTLPDEEPHGQAGRLRWLGRDELAQAQWSSDHEELARMVGIYWDHIFQAEHL